MRDMQNMNRETFTNEAVVGTYRNACALLQPEIVILDELKDELPTASVLDLGIGTGRTTLHLKDRCRRYTGVDYSPAMLQIARERFPDADLREMDAGDLSAFDDDDFDIVIFSFNGIDYAPPERRIKIIGEVHRILRPGGAFVFSTHNRGTTIESAYDLQNLGRTLRVKDLLSNVTRYLSGIIHAAQMKKYLRHEMEYAVLNDNAHEYRLLHYYIAPKAQVVQLERHGFRSLFCVGLGGNRLDLDAADSSPDPWIYYFARKRG
jgi:SAM-dependent methyltransferase